MHISRILTTPRPRPRRRPPAPASPRRDLVRNDKPAVIRHPLTPPPTLAVPQTLSRRRSPCDHPTVSPGSRPERCRPPWLTEPSSHAIAGGRGRGAGRRKWRGGAYLDDVAVGKCEGRVRGSRGERKEDGGQGRGGGSDERRSWRLTSWRQATWWSVECECGALSAQRWLGLPCQLAPL